MKHAYEVAELLDEILKHADPHSVLTKWTLDMIGNTRRSNVGFRMASDPGESTYTVTYLIPVESTMAGVSGTPQEVLEWLRTGLGPGQKAELETGGKVAQFAITQVHRDPHVVDDMEKLVWKSLKVIVQSGKSGPNAAAAMDEMEKPGP